MLEIPQRWRKKLKNDLRLQGAVDATLGRYGDILKHSKFEFFPEYTDHGVDHVQDVLNSCDWLMTDAALNKIRNKLCHYL
jgi:molecular chaperone HtpG